MFSYLFSYRLKPSIQIIQKMKLGTLYCTDITVGYYSCIHCAFRGRKFTVVLFIVLIYFSIPDENTSRFLSSQLPKQRRRAGQAGRPPLAAGKYWQMETISELIYSDLQYLLCSEIREPTMVR